MINNKLNLYDEDKLNFYIRSGFNEDYSIIMEAQIIEDFQFDLPKNMSVVDLEIDSEKSNVSRYNSLNSIAIKCISFTS